MNYALALNALIIVCVIVGMVLSSSPMPLIALMMLKEMPYGLMQPTETIEKPYEGSSGFGFSAPPDEMDDNYEEE